MSGIGDRAVARHVLVPYSVQNATVRARAIQWIDRLRDAGRLDPNDVVVHGPGWPRAEVPAGANVLLLRNVGRLTRGGRERRLLDRAGLAVYDLDDGLPWDDGRLPGLGRWWKRPFPRSLVAERAARSADRMIVGNDVLADWATTRCADVRIVPTCVEPSEYRQRATWDVGDVPVIGWIGSSATEPYLVEIASALVQVHRATGARVEMISGPGAVPNELAPFTSKSIWSPGSSTRVAEWDVGIMPLRDGVYERAKCGYKLLQYASSGVPAVAAPVGVNGRLLADMDGLAAGALDEWTGALEAVLTEPSARRAERARCGLAVAKAHSYEAWESVWVDAVGW